jgi:hypothetical protein
LIAMSNNILAAVAVSAAAILLLAGALQLKHQDVGNSVDGFPRFVPLHPFPKPCLTNQIIFGSEVRARDGTARQRCHPCCVNQAHSTDAMLRSTIEIKLGRRSELLLSPSAKRKLKEAVDLAGKAPSEQERRHIESILSPVANHLAVRYGRRPQHQYLPLNTAGACLPDASFPVHPRLVPRDLSLRS